MQKKLFLISFLTIIHTANSQIISLAETIKSGVNDANKILNAYLKPLEKELCSASGNGFVSKINTDKKPKFAINIIMIGSISPKTDRTYDVNNLHLENIKPSDENNTVAQTFSGTEQTIPLETKQTYRTIENWHYVEKPILTFNSPKGSNYSYIAFPMLNLGLSTYNSNFNVRFLPTIKIPNSDATFFSLGASIQHRINNYFTFLKNSSFDFSLMMGYQITKINYDINVVPDETYLTFNLNQNNGPYDNQIFTLQAQSIPFELVVSKQIKYFTYLVGFGLNIQHSNVALLGNYPVYKTDPSNLTKIMVDDITDPIKYRRLNNALKFDLGLKYNIKFFSINANFVYATYKAFSLGFGVNF